MFGVIGGGKMGIQLTKLLSGTENVVFIVRDIKKAKSAYIARYPNITKNTHIGNHLDRIIFTQSLDELKGCQIVFECLPEILDLKIKIINQVSNIVSSPIASCTSTISLRKMNPYLVGANKVNIIHFSNPISATKIAEVVFSENISNDEKFLITDLFTKLNFDYVQVPDIDGFVVNSLLFPLLHKSIQIHIDFGIPKADIDKLMKQACKFPMGPFEIINLVGVDTVVAVFQNLKLEVDSKVISALNK